MVSCKYCLKQSPYSGKFFLQKIASPVAAHLYQSVDKCGGEIAKLAVPVATRRQLRLQKKKFLCNMLVIRTPFRWHASINECILIQFSLTLYYKLWHLQKNLWERTNLWEETKSPVPNVITIRMFYCSSLLSCSLFPEPSQLCILHFSFSWVMDLLLLRQSLLLLSIPIFYYNLHFNWATEYNEALPIQKCQHFTHSKMPTLHKLC